MAVFSLGVQDHAPPWFGVDDAPPDVLAIHRLAPLTRSRTGRRFFSLQVLEGAPFIQA
jgi:hypothetical protein